MVTFRNFRTYKYLVCVGLLQAIGYLLCLLLFLFAFVAGVVNDTINASGGAVVLPILFLIAIIAIGTIIATLVIPIVSLIDIFKPIQTSQEFMPLWLEILALLSYVATIVIIVFMKFSH